VKQGEGMDKEIVPGDHLEPDQTRIELIGADPKNPRLRIDVPADKMFVEISDTPQPYLIVVVRADKTIPAKGVLAHAHDMLLLREHELDKRAALTQGVRDALTKDLTKLPTGGKA
jgi:hypothetical protein